MKSVDVLWIPLVAGLTALTACMGGSATCDEAACAPICEGRPAPAAVTPATGGGGSALALTDFEESLLKSVVDDVRQGVRPMDDQSLGVCTKGEGRDCPEMLGMTPGELPEGEYILYGSFAVPTAGEKGTWKVRLETECTTTRTTPNGESTNSSQYAKDYDVVYSPKGYRLSPLRRISSPGKNGAQKCTFKIVSPHGDGDKVYEGSWSVPDGSS